MQKCMLCKVICTAYARMQSAHFQNLHMQMWHPVLIYKSSYLGKLNTKKSEGHFFFFSLLIKGTIGICTLYSLTGRELTYAQLRIHTHPNIPHPSLQPVFIRCKTPIRIIQCSLSVFWHSIPVYGVDTLSPNIMD